jgi:mycothiol synthase
MVWRAVPSLGPRRVPAGYELRQIRNDEKQTYEALFNVAWPEAEMFDAVYEAALPGGFFGVEHTASGLLVSSCAALKRGVFEAYPDVGSLGWLVTDRAHGGHGLATCVVLAVMNRLQAEGFDRAYLSTEDERLTAIRIYLGVGWEPLLYTDGMEERWQSIRSALQAGEYWP